MKYLTYCCNEVIESRSRHDFRRCPCGKSFVDGGNDYSRVGFEGCKPPVPLDKKGVPMLDPADPPEEPDEDECRFLPDPDYLPFEDMALLLTNGMKDQILRALRLAYERGLKERV